MFGDYLVIELIVSEVRYFAAFLSIILFLFFCLGLLGFSRHGCDLQNCLRGALLWMYGGSFFTMLLSLYITKKMRL